MAGITGVGGLPAPTQIRRPATRSGAAFRCADPALPGLSEGGEAAAEVGGLAGLLALQEAAAAGTADAAPAARDRQARRRGHAILDALAAVQRDSLRGAVDPALLRDLALHAQAPPEDASPPLRAVLDEIVLRARIELARRDAG